VSGNTITITNRGPREASTTVTFTIDASNAVVVKGNATSTVGSIAVGDVILVKGTITGTNVVATKIFDGPMMQKIGERMEDRRGNHASSTPPFQGNGQPVVAGTVSAVSGNTITIINSGNASYTVDVSGAKIIVKGNQNASVSNVSIEDHVVVQGAVNGASITATSVLDGTNNSGNGGDNGGEDKGPKGFFGGIGGFFKHLFGF
jgi:formylmethanofuran dehydrogenase subunit C